MGAVAARAVEPAVTSASRYETLTTDRSPFLERAKRVAKLTIPFLFNDTKNANIAEDYQSLGARCVNNLASKLFLVLFPPGGAFFKLTVDDFVMEQLGGAEASSNVETALAKIERSVTKRMEAGGYRAPIATALKHLIVSGNGLLQVLPEGGIKFRSLANYVVKRDMEGNVLEIIAKDEMARESLPENIKATLLASPLDQAKGNDEKSIAVYTHVKRVGSRWKVEQEVGGVKVPKSGGTYPKDKCPFLALRFLVVEGEDYGRGYVEEFRGDLASYDSLQMSMVGFAAVAAKILFFTDETGFTRRIDVQNARTGDILEGNSKDISVLQLEKTQDFGVMQAVAEGIKLRLEQAFLMASSAQRNAERVTAEEIRLIAGELEQTLGGIYSVLAQELQLPLVTLFMAQLQREGKLPALPQDTVTPTIVTGMEGLGRNTDLQRLQSLMANLSALGPEAITEYLIVGDYIQRVSTALSIDAKGMIRSEQDVQKAREVARQQALAEKAVGPAINATGASAPVA